MRDRAVLYADVTSHVVAAGRGLLTQAGRLPDIGGARKDFLTTEDLRIETELTALVRREHPGQVVFAEELSPELANDDLDDVWVIDPISSTEAFLAGLAHYAVVATHLLGGVPEFAVVYDPSVDELFTARRGEGAWLNGRALAVTAQAKEARRTRIVAALTRSEVGTPAAAAWWSALAPYDVVRPIGSFALHYAGVAAGRYDGVLARTKDAFVEFAGWLLITEAGGTFASGTGSPPTHHDRWFYGGSDAVVPTLSALVTALMPTPDPASPVGPADLPDPPERTR